MPSCCIQIQAAPDTSLVSYHGLDESSTNFLDFMRKSLRSRLSVVTMDKYASNGPVAT